MATPFIMPKFDMDQENATIVSWLKQEGDSVQQDEPVLTVETDKVAIEVTAPAAGRLAAIGFREGDVVPVTTVIAYILAEGEDVDGLPSPATPAKAPARHGAAPAAKRVTPVARRMAEDLGLDLGQMPGGSRRLTKADVESLRKSVPPPPGKAAATPAARRLARERAIDLREVSGSGPRGRIQSADVTRAADAPHAPPRRTGQEVQLTGMRRTIAERMQASFREAPHISLTVETDVTALEQARTRLNGRAGGEAGPGISLTATLVRLAACALERHPYLNASFQEDAIYLWTEINIGVATAVPDGLIVPVIHGANRLSVTEIARELQHLTEKAQSGRLDLADVHEGTFTISNLGMFGVHQFRAVINPPESAILAVGAVTRRPVAAKGGDQVVVRPIVTLTLSADHRVLDGVRAAAFLQELVRAIEAPDTLLE